MASSVTVVGDALAMAFFICSARPPCRYKPNSSYVNFDEESFSFIDFPKILLVTYAGSTILTDTWYGYISWRTIAYGFKRMLFHDTSRPQEAL